MFICSRIAKVLASLKGYCPIPDIVVVVAVVGWDKDINL